MTVVATDDFNRADGALGANWTAISPETMPNIIGNQAAGTTTLVDYGGKYTAASTGAADHYAQIDVVINVSTTTQEAGAWVRAPSGTTGNGYLGMSPTYTAGTHKIYSVAAGSFTQLATTGTGPLGTGTRTIKMVAQGTTLTLFTDGVSSLSTTNATYTGTNQFCGFHIYWDTSGTNNNVRVDNFEQGDLVAGGGPVGKAYLRSNARQRASVR